MKLLIVAATEGEIQPFLNWFNPTKYPVEVLITGVGMVATAFAIGQKLNTKPFDMLLNVGIAGAFSQNTPLGSIFRVNEDCFAELGAEHGEQFISLDDLNLGSSSFNENPGTVLGLKAITHLPFAKSITVNQVHGNEVTIRKIQNRLSPDIESMEGAAIFYAAKQAGIYALQVRSISNIVENRNKNNWDIPLAIQNLNKWLIEFVKEYSMNLSNLKNK